MHPRLKGALTLILPHPLPEIAAEHLYLYLDAMWRTREVGGSVVEVGCFQCGTSAWAMRMLRAMGVDREYVCVDTFGGFVDSQFAHDVQRGTAASLKHGFTFNSPRLVRRFLARWGVPEIKLLEADVVALPATALPPRIAVALVDVDLEEPTFAALEKIYPRLAAGGTIVVDDCSVDPTNPYRGARVGFQRFVQANSLPERYLFGMGVIDKPAPATA
jgi:O-methyltransferase